MKVLVAGAGVMGSGIAQVVAEAGFDTTLFDADAANLDRGIQGIHARWQRAVEGNKRDDAFVAQAADRLHAGTLDDAGVADVIIEAIFEQLDAKADLLRELGTRAKLEALLASNTSSISITALGRASGSPRRFIGLHFFNPVPVLPLVEVVKGLESDPAAVQEGVAFVEGLGKVPVVVEDAPGFVANRILLPMINEAIFALQENVAPRENIDQIMKLGMAHPMGPLALADLIGLDVCLDILDTLQRDFGDDKYRPAPLLRRMVAAGKLGRKTGQGFYAYPLQSERPSRSSESAR
jgi:3-hydroxybutyryl-CoA dehydrogenase